ncbi:MAG: glycosyltransferase family 4 protein [Prevotellaceae bacterium]|nr:glycosyltransferase family 4 protein [Prevotellaceae bacterium]
MDNISQKQHVLQIFASRFWGGGEQYVYDLSKALFENGYELSLVSRKSKDIYDKINPLNIRLFTLPLKTHFDICSIYRLFRIIDKHGVDLIHTHQFKDAFIALFARALSRNKPKVVLTRHLVKKAKNGFIYRWLYRRIDKIIFVSALARDAFLSSHPAICAKKIRVIHNSISPSPQFEDDDIRTRYSINSKTVVLAFTGRIVQEKGVEVLIDSLNKIKHLDFYLLIAGKGDKKYEEKLQNKILSCGLSDKVKFTGFLDKVQSFIRQVDIGIVPSVWAEPFGLSIIEFMQAGKAVITTNNGAQPEFVTDKQTGILIPPCDSTALANAIESLILNAEQRISLGVQAKEMFEKKLSYSVFFNRILSVYSEVDV